MSEAAAAPAGRRLELWGGIEPTLNRVGDRYHSQLERSGHHARASDLDRCAELGIRRLRYPVLWERTMPRRDGDADWRWPDERLSRLRALGIAPIVGLLHHGSGPRYTSLVDREFPAKLAEFASCVARRYPWVDAYTPVNEPLTTARFSALYGVWYPHARSARAFTKALLGQCRGVALAMRAIRQVNADAKLVQTDDLGKTYSTPALHYQAEFNNEFRWIAWDLLCGKVDRGHPLWDWLRRRGGASEAALMAFVDDPCLPDVVGVNHYVTSERFLTEDVGSYAPRFHGGNGRHRYADVEASRCLTATDGLRGLLDEAWSRYRLPLAVTEAHIDSTRDDQLRWIAEIWRAAEEAHRSHVDVRAVTLWALFGVFDWNCLVTECRGYYEPGAFDVRASPPRPTAIAALAKSLAAGSAPSHPLLAGPGWWKRGDRFYAAPVELGHAAPSPSPHESRRPLVITGATGTLGRAFGRICEQRGIEHRLLSRNELDIADPRAIDAVLRDHRPWAVINAAGYVRVDDAERDVERCMRENTRGPAALASACAGHGAAFLTFSSDLVFDGEHETPYVESDAPAPLNAYGRSKADAESRVLERYPGALVVRTSAFFGPWDEHNFVIAALRALHARRHFRAAGDLVVSPTYVPDLVNVSLDLLIDGAAGVWHLSNGEALSWAAFARRVAAAADLRGDLVASCEAATLGFVARRPRYSALASERSMLMPTLDNALDRFLAVRPRPDMAVRDGSASQGSDQVAPA